MWRWLEKHGEQLGLGKLVMAHQVGIITNHIEQRSDLQSIVTGTPRAQLSSPGRSGGGGLSGEAQCTVQAIDTVDSYQGSERDVIILSPLCTARAADRRLLNVGLSRAKRLVVVVGSLDSLAEKHEIWASLVRHIRAEGIMLDVAAPDAADLKGQLQEIVEGGVATQANAGGKRAVGPRHHAHHGDAAGCSQQSDGTAGGASAGAMLAVSTPPRGGARNVKARRCAADSEQ